MSPEYGSPRSQQAVTMTDDLADLTLRPIAEFDAEAAPVAHAIAGLIAALALSDGMLTPHRYQHALVSAENCADLTSNPDIIKSLTMRMLLSPPALGTALGRIASNRAAIPEVVRSTLIDALIPLVKVQGDGGRDTLGRIADALGVAIDHRQIEMLELEPRPGMLTTLARRTTSLFRPQPELTLAKDVARVTLDEHLSQVLKSTREPPTAADIEQAIDRAVALLETTRSMADAYADQLELANQLENSAALLERQVQQRLRAVGRRINQLRQHMREDIWAIAEDAGDEFEVDLRRRLESGFFLKRAEETDLVERQT